LAGKSHRRNEVNDPLGTLSTVDGRPVLRFERRFPHAPAKVWRAITEPEQLAHWFPATVHTEHRPGAPIKFDVGVKDSSPFFAEGEVLEYDPPKVYAFRWADSVLRFELLADDIGCLLVFTHTLSGARTWGDLPSTARQATGWHHCLGLLVSHVDGQSAVSDAPPFLPRLERYVEEFGLAEGDCRDTASGRLLRFERDLLRPVAETWSMLTGGDTALAAGSPVPMWATHSGMAAGVSTVVDGPHMLEYDWRHDGAPAGGVRLTLAQQKPVGCRLVVAVTVPDRLTELCPGMLADWQVHLELFFAALHGAGKQQWPSVRAEKLRHRYATDLGS
jgi:uncharacterized protein YndB with AHSA1/START domain